MRRPLDDGYSLVSKTRNVQVSSDDQRFVPLNYNQTEIDKFEKERKLRTTPLNVMLMETIARCKVATGRARDGEMFNFDVFIEHGGPAVVAGVGMERTAEMLKAVNEEVKESKHILEQLHNEIRAVVDTVHPELLDLIKRIRDSRMTATREMRDILGELKEVRKFFIDSDYKAEIERMERFVRLCKEMKDLKESGMLDALSDTVIKLALKQEAK